MSHGGGGHGGGGGGQAQSMRQQQDIADSLVRSSRERDASPDDHDAGAKRTRRSGFDAPVAHAGEGNGAEAADAAAGGDAHASQPPAAPAAPGAAIDTSDFARAVREAAARAAALLAAKNAGALLPPAAASYPPASSPLGGLVPLSALGALQASGTTVEILSAAPDACGKIIGRGGETISQLQAQTGASIKVQSSSEVTAGQNRRVTISGLPHAVAAAKREVEKFMQETPVVTGPAIVGGLGTYSMAPALGSEDGSGVTVMVPPDMVGRVIGRGGETIRRLQEESGARIQIERDQNQLRIRGTNQAIENAKRLVSEVINAPVAGGGGGHALAIGGAGGGGGHGFGGGGGGASALLPTLGQEGRIIGRGGETIRELQGRHGARIQIDRAAGTATITAPTQQQVDECARAVTELVSVAPPSRFGGGGAGMYGGGYAQQQQQQMMGGGGGGYGGGGGGGGYGGGYPQQAAPPQQQPLWTPQTTGEGHVYYYNTQTGESVWERPAGY